MRGLPTAFAVALMLGCVAAPAQAQEPTPLQRMLGNWGLLEIPSDDNIDYRERAPLVVPPSNELPVPYIGQDVATAVPDWPTDPEVVERRRQKEQPKYPLDKTRDPFWSGRTLTRDELRRGTTNTRPIGARPAAESDKTAGREPQTVTGGLFGMFKSDQTPIQFTGEPPRINLTDPPAGYLTPSPNAPYGVVEKDKPGTEKISSPFDRLHRQQ